MRVTRQKSETAIWRRRQKYFCCRFLRADSWPSSFWNWRIETTKSWVSGLTEQSEEKLLDQTHDKERNHCGWAPEILGAGWRMFQKVHHHWSLHQSGSENLPLVLHVWAQIEAFCRMGCPVLKVEWTSCYFALTKIKCKIVCVFCNQRLFRWWCVETASSMPETSTRCSAASKSTTPSQSVSSHVMPSLLSLTDFQAFSP